MIESSEDDDSRKTITERSDVYDFRMFLLILIMGERLFVIFISKRNILMKLWIQELPCPKPWGSGRSVFLYKS